MKSKFITKTKVAVCLMCCILLAGVVKRFANWQIAAYADSLAPRVSYKIELENGNKFFYMNGKKDGQEEDEGFLELDSGLYYTHSLENIYLIDPVIHQGKSYAKYIYKEDLIISEDGMCFANFLWTGFAGFLFFGKAGVAAEFYLSGCMTKQYNLSDLTFNRMKFESSVSHILWEDRAKREFDTGSNILSVTTLNNKTIVFDLSTGGIVRKPLSGFDIAAILTGFVAGVLVIAAVGFAILKRKKKTRHKDKQI